MRKGQSLQQWYWENWMSFVHFSIDLSSSYWVISLYILNTNALWDIWFTDIFSHFMGCTFLQQLTVFLSSLETVIQKVIKFWLHSTNIFKSLLLIYNIKQDRKSAYSPEFSIWGEIRKLLFISFCLLNNERIWAYKFVLGLYCPYYAYESTLFSSNIL